MPFPLITNHQHYQIRFEMDEQGEFSAWARRPCLPKAESPPREKKIQQILLRADDATLTQLNAMPDADRQHLLTEHLKEIITDNAKDLFHIHKTWTGTYLLIDVPIKLPTTSHALSPYHMILGLIGTSTALALLYNRTEPTNFIGYFTLNLGVSMLKRVACTRAESFTASHLRNAAMETLLFVTAPNVLACRAQLQSATRYSLMMGLQVADSLWQWGKSTFYKKPEPTLLTLLTLLTLHEAREHGSMSSYIIDQARYVALPTLSPEHSPSSSRSSTPTSMRS